MATALSIIEEKDKFIERLKDQLQKYDANNDFLNLKDDLPQLSPESSQYPDGASNPGGDSTILNAQHLALSLWKKLKKITLNSQFISGNPIAKKKIHDPIEKKSYTLDEGYDPYKVKSTSVDIITDNSNLNEMINKMEEEVNRKRKASEMEEYVDFEKESNKNEMSNPNYSEGKNSLQKVNKKKKMSDNVEPRCKRMKLEEKEDSLVIIEHK